MAEAIRIAYIISCYKQPELVVRLSKVLQNRSAIIVIHVDKKSDDSIYNHIKENLKSYGNIALLPRHNCNYCDYGHVKVSVKGINYLIDNNIKFDRLILLTGQCYPIQSLNSISEFFKNNSSAYMTYFKLPTKNWLNGGLDRVDRFHFWVMKRHYSVPKKSSVLMVNDLQLYGGSSYWSITCDQAKYIYNFLKGNQWFERFFKHTYISDELFFQTILLNSKYKRSVVNKGIHYIDWNDPVEMPKILRQSDYKKIVSTDYLFGRKFDMSVDKEILDKIDAERLAVPV